MDFSSHYKAFAHMQWCSHFTLSAYSWGLPCISWFVGLGLDIYSRKACVTRKQPEFHANTNVSHCFGPRKKKLWLDSANKYIYSENCIFCSVNCCLTSMKVISWLIGLACIFWMCSFDPEWSKELTKSTAQLSRECLLIYLRSMLNCLPMGLLSLFLNERFIAHYLREMCRREMPCDCCRQYLRGS